MHGSKRKILGHSGSGFGTLITYFAEGRFTWGDGDISVTLPEGGNDYTGSVFEIYDEDVTSGTKNPLLGKKYAYVTYKFKAKHIRGSINSFSVTVKVNTEGEQI